MEKLYRKMFNNVLYVLRGPEEKGCELCKHWTIKNTHKYDYIMIVHKIFTSVNSFRFVRKKIEFACINWLDFSKNAK